MQTYPSLLLLVLKSNQILATLHLMTLALKYLNLS